MSSFVGFRRIKVERTYFCGAKDSKVVVNGVEGAISSVGDTAVPESSVDTPGIAGPASGWYNVGVVLIDLDPGVYRGTLTVKTYEPFELLFGAA